ncbi:MAG: hypothetical protein IPM17_05615 [Verrucomicrobia bacterium]|jgi:hypothetical protein|nr:hypothetical protein [Verrucomicrobiota bacterium]
MRKLPLQKLVAVSAVASALPSYAVVLVQYDFASSLAPSTVDSNVTASDVGQSDLPNMSVVGGQLSVPASDIAVTTAVATTDYIQFTVTPNAPLLVNLASLTFDIGRVFTGGYTAGYAVFSSVDSYGASIGSGSLTGASGTLTGISLDLSGPAYQGLSSITFRIGLSDGNNGANNSIRVDNLTLNGAVVPEPHEYAAMAGLGLLGFAVWRRARRA